MSPVRGNFERGRLVMARRERYVDVSELRQASAWERVLEELRATGVPAIIRAEGEAIAELRPARRKQPPRRLRGRPTSAEDPLWGLDGIGHSGRHNICENHDRYPAEPRPGNREASHDALRGIVGMIADDGLGDVSSHKQDYLARAYAPKSRQKRTPSSR